MAKAQYSLKDSPPKAHRVSNNKERERHTNAAEISYGRKLKQLDDMIAMLEEGRFQDSGMNPYQLQIHVQTLMQQFQQHCT
jgi:hypothetical protein